jgi:hypothetical protein
VLARLPDNGQPDDKEDLTVQEEENYFIGFKKAFA